MTKRGAMLSHLMLVTTICQSVRACFSITPRHIATFACVMAFALMAGCNTSEAPPPPVSVTLTVATNGTGTGTVTSNPSGINCGAACILTVNSGTVVTLTAAPSPNNTLSSWNGACPTATPTCAVTVTSDLTVTATFDASSANPNLNLTIDGTGSGNVTCNGGSCNATYPWGTSVTLSGVPQAGSSFAGWNGGNCSGTADCTVILWGDTAITATFNQLPPTAQLTVTKTGTGAGTVTSSPAGITCGGTCSATFNGGDVVTLTATASAGSTFVGWSGGGCSGTGTCEVMLTGDTTVTATFNTVPPMVTLSVTTLTNTGGAGTVTCNGSPCNTPSPNILSYPSGTAVTLIATPDSKSLFNGWGGACASAGTTTTCDLTLTADSAVVATFNRPTLSVVLAGTGTVTSSPSGINCGATCTAPFDKGTSVTLTATGANFSGWTGGGCSGTGTCVVSLNGDVTITATFGSGPVAGKYHFFTKEGGPLLVVSSTNPGATPGTVSSTFTDGGLVLHGTWDATSKQFTNLESAYLVYASDGKIWRVSATGSAGVPGSGANPPIQISTEAAAFAICDALVVDISPTPETARVAYELGGGDGQCSTSADNVIKVVTVSDTSATPPSVLATGVSLNNDQRAVYNLTTGVATHLFVTDVANTNTAKLVNLSTKAVTTIQANTPALQILAQDTSDRVFVRNSLEVPTPHSLYVYTISSNSLVPLVSATGSGILFDGNLQTSDGTNLYVASGGTLYRVPLTSTSAGDVVQLYDNALTLITGVYHSTNRVYVVQIDFVTGGMGLLSVPKTGGTPRVDVAPATNNAVLPVSFSRDGLVYYTRLTASPPPPGSFFPVITSATAEIAREDGTTVLSEPNAWLSQGIFESWFGIRAESVSPSQVFLLTSPGMSFSGGTLSAIDAATGTQVIMMGTIPSSWNIAMLPSFPFFMFDFLGSSALGIANSGDPIDPNNTFNLVFFVDSAVTNSLIQVPVAGTGWFPVF